MRFINLFFSISFFALALLSIASLVQYRGESIALLFGVLAAAFIAVSVRFSLSIE